MNLTVQISHTVSCRAAFQKNKTFTSELVHQNHLRVISFIAGSLDNGWIYRRSSQATSFPLRDDKFRALIELTEKLTDCKHERCSIKKLIFN